MDMEAVREYEKKSQEETNQKVLAEVEQPCETLTDSKAIDKKTTENLEID